MGSFIVLFLPCRVLCCCGVVLGVSCVVLVVCLCVRPVSLLTDSDIVTCRPACLLSWHHRKRSLLLQARNPTVPNERSAFKPLAVLGSQ